MGKSTLMNHLIGQKIAITSAKPQTTRNQIETVYTEDRGQIVFLDTPGIHPAKNKLGEYMDLVTDRTLESVDLVLWLLDITFKASDREREIAKKLTKTRKPVICVINKADKTDKMTIASLMQEVRQLMRFEDVIPVAALKDINLDTLLSAIFTRLPEGPLYYDEETVTRQTIRELSAEIIREKALRLLSDEVPHGIAVEIESMKERRPGLYDVEATLFCEKESHKGIVIGKGGEKLKQIGSQARTDIEALLESQVNLKLWVKVQKDWRDNASFLNGIGYKKKDLK